MQGYAEDLEMVMRSKNLSTVTDLMWGCFKAVNVRVKTKKLFINLKKIEVVPFIIKRKTDEVLRV